MTGKEGRQCPHYNIHEGVCGCPEFWQPARRTKKDQTLLTLQEVPNTRYGQHASNNRFSSSVHSITLPDRTKIQPTTPAPPGPPKETCFFWYHGACRRGNECERPHEAHPTWPIPPPPGFRHFQDCTLPLCPLRTDLDAAQKPQEYQRRRRTLGGQMDGAAFSRATTAGESLSDSDSIDDTDTDLGEITDNPSQVLNQYILGVCTQASVVSKTSDEVGTGQEGEVRAQQELGKNELESDYVDLSQLLFPPSTLLTQDEPLLSISHSGTLGKRQAPAHSPDSNNKRVKLEEDNAVDLSDTVSILERPRVVAQCDAKPPGFGLNGQHPEPSAHAFRRIHSFTPQPSAMPVTNTGSASPASRAFDPPKAPRRMSALPLICFFYYHKGYCHPRSGRKCDYLHDMNKSQQTVSLPHGIDNHDPICSLPLCPVRLKRLNQVKHEPDCCTPSMHCEVKHEPVTPPRIYGSHLRRVTEPSPHDIVLSVRGRPPRRMIGQALPQLIGATRERFHKQKRRIEQTQAERGMSLNNPIFIDNTDNQNQGERKSKSRRRHKQATRLRRQLEEEDTIGQGLTRDSNTSNMQLQPPFQPIMEESQASATAPPVGHLNKKRRKRGNRKPLHSQRAEGQWLGDSVKDEGSRRITPETVQESSSAFAVRENLPAGIDGALQMVDTTNQDPRKWRPLVANLQCLPARSAVPHEYSQESLGWSTEKRHTEILERQAAYETWRLSHENGSKLRSAASDGAAILAASVAASLSFASLDEGDEGLERRSRCQRCCKMQKDCESQGLCQGRKHAGDGNDSCPKGVVSNISEETGNVNAVSGSAARYRLPEGNERLDWDTDLVRQLFGEID